MKWGDGEIGGEGDNMCNLLNSPRLDRFPFFVVIPAQAGIQFSSSA